MEAGESGRRECSDRRVDLAYRPCACWLEEAMRSQQNPDIALRSQNGTSNGS